MDDVDTPMKSPPKEDVPSPPGSPSKEAASGGSVKCLKCTKAAKKGCVDNLCLKCCTNESCQVHKEQREKALYREQVMNGTTDLQLQAKLKRSKIILPKRFKEPNFKYMGDTVVVWDMRQCFKRYKDDILRKAHKRKARSGDGSCQTKTLRNSRKRFRAVYERMYQQSLNKK